jgi:hypothetical protein
LEQYRAWTKNPIERTSQAQWVTMSLMRLAKFHWLSKRSDRSGKQ